MVVSLCGCSTAAVDAQGTAEASAEEWRGKHDAAVAEAEAAARTAAADKSEAARMGAAAEERKAEAGSSAAAAAHANERAEELQKQLLAQQSDWHDRERAEHVLQSSRLSDAESARKLAEEQVRAAKAALASAEGAHQQVRHCYLLATCYLLLAA